MLIRSRTHLGTTFGLLGATLAAFVVAQGCGGNGGGADGAAGKDPLATGGSAGSAGHAATGGTTSASGGKGGSGATGSGATGGTGIVIEHAGEAGQAGGGGAPANNCGEMVLNSSRPVVNLLLVVDKSSSMTITDEFPEGRWTALGNALGAALDQASSRVSFGLEFFPFSDDPNATPGTCEMPKNLDVLIPVAAGDQTVPQIKDALSTYMPAGGTPTADALARADDYFVNGAGKDLNGTNYVLLATDGGPNCNADATCDASTCTINLEHPDATTGCGGSCCDPKLDPDGNSNCLDESRTVTAVQTLAGHHIKTFVVGIPGSQFFANTLEKLAVAGLEPNPNAPPSYYAVTSSDGAQGLTDVLKSITSGLITTCRLQLASTPQESNWQILLNVKIDGSDVPKDGADGWSVDGTTSPPTIVLSGTTCDYLEQHGAEKVQITFGCPTVMVK
jgi:hypothetical protein